MNKEQKSFWEYGAAWATTVVIHTCRDKKSHYGEVLKDAWRWRRICRNITNKTPKKTLPKLYPFVVKVALQFVY
jgi:hypothetical protein